MRADFRRRTQTPLRTLALAAGLLAAAPAARAATDFHAIVDGAHANPPNNSTARGAGQFVLNDAQTELSYDIEFDPWVSSTEIASHIHMKDPAGGDLIIHELPPGPSKIGVMAIESDGWLAALFGGRLYVNVHTTAVLSGEVTGTIEAGSPAAAATWGRIKALFR